VASRSQESFYVIPDLLFLVVTGPGNSDEVVLFGKVHGEILVLELRGQALPCP